MNEGWSDVIPKGGRVGAVGDKRCVRGAGHCLCLLGGAARDIHGPGSVVHGDVMVHQGTICKVAQWVGRGEQESTDWTSSEN